MNVLFDESFITFDYVFRDIFEFRFNAPNRINKLRNLYIYILVDKNDSLSIFYDVYKILDFRLNWL